MLKSYLSKLSAFALLLGMSFGSFAQNVTISSPASIAGDYLSKHAAFGGWLNGQTGELVLADDGTGTTNGCTITNDMAGKIALIDRGVCGFAVKAINAQNAGAIGVVICNNNPAIPDSTIVMGGADCNITIPAVMLTLNMCNTIKAVLATEAVTAAFPVNYPGDGNGFQAQTVLPGAGIHTTPVLDGPSPFTDSDGAKYFTITAPSDGVMNVNSCASGVDTRVTVFEGCRNAVTLIDTNDDACGSVPPDNEPYSSSLDVIVRAGQSYTIVWDNLWDAQGFDFEVSFGALPDVSVTMNVDMTYTAAAGDGVKISINGGAEEAMTNVGGTIWSYTTTVEAGSTVDYRFVNGTGNPEDDALVGTCRTIAVGLEPVETIPYCYNDCFPCPPPVDCSNPNAIICDNFDGYTAGSTTGNSAAHWSTWSGTVGTTEDGIVSEEQAFSAPNSMLIAEGGTQDVLLLLGNRTSGVYSLSWKMYIPAGKIGYHNIQEDETPAVQWNHEVYFGQNGVNGPATPGTGVENNTNTTFAFPHDAWFDVKYSLDLDNDKVAFFVNGVLVTSWDFVDNLGAINFYSANAATNRFYIDDVIYEQLPSCRNTAIICDNLEFYPVPGFTAADGADWWSTWSGAEGGAEDGILSNEQAYSGTTSMKIGNNGAQDVLLLLGNQTEGQYRLSWQMYIPAGSHAYYNIQNEETPGVQWNLDLFFNRDVAGASTPGVGVVSQSTTTFSVIEDAWFEVAMAFDLDNDQMSLFLDGQLLETTPYVGNIGSVDFFSIDTDNTYYVDDVEFLLLPSCAPDAIICDGYEFYGPNTTTGGQAPWWDTWSGTFGTAEDGVVTNVIASTGANSMFIGNTGTQDVLLNLGNRSTGVYDLSFDMYIPAGQVAYYNMQNSETAGQQWNFNVHFGNDAAGATAVFGTGIIPEAGNAAFTYPENTWFPILHSFDLDNNTYSVFINGVEVVSQAAYAGNLGAIDFFSISPDNAYFLDDVYFVQSLPPIPTVDVTFRVNMERETVSAGGVRIAGSFNGWTDETMTNVGNDIWEITKEFEVGTAIQWKFKNGPNGWESNAALIDCGVDDGGNINRATTIGDVNETLGTYCFNWCVDCDALSANESAFAKAIGVNPNPAGTYVNVTYNFESMVNLNVRLMNTLGQTLLERNLDNALNGSERFDIASLPSGAYTVVFSNGEQTVAKRLIVE